MVLLIVLFAVALLAQSLEETGRIAQGFQANTEDQDGQFEFGQSAKVQAKKSARGGTSGSFPIAFQLPMESSSIAAEGIVISTIDR